MNPVPTTACGSHRHGGSSPRAEPDRRDLDGLLDEAVEELAPPARGAPVEPERELIEVAIQMLARDAALVDAQEPPFQQRRDPMHARQQGRGRVAAATDVPRLMGVAIAGQARIGGPSIGGDDGAGRHGLPHVHWHGPYDHQALGQILAELDVVVVPSIWYENQPLVILEAFAARVPVVATDLGGMQELVRDRCNGLLFLRGDALALARCLEQLAQDRALLTRLRQGIQQVKGIEAHVRELETVYQQLVNPTIVTPWAVPANGGT